MIINERLDKTTLKELLRLAEAKEKRAQQDKSKSSAEHWYMTAEWLRDLLGEDAPR